MKKSRLDYSIMNSGISTGIYIVRLIVQFVARTFFIKYLGTEILGLNGLFTNILSLLSVADMGIGTSIIFSMYKPLSNGDHEQVKSLMALYKKAYEAIGATIAVIGLAIVPFLHLIVAHSERFPQLYLIYILFLANSVVSYFFTYKRSLISADQKAYIVSLNDFFFLLITNIFQIIFLMVTANFVVYLIIQIISTVAGNICISMIVDHRYPYIKEKKVKKLDHESVDEIKKNVIGNVSSKVGGQLVTGTDNILISTFVNLTAVGLYSNYTLIINALLSVCTQMTTSITASIGNFAVSEDEKGANRLYRRYFFINHSLAYFTSVMLMVMLNPFIKVWIGSKFELPLLTVILIVINFSIQVYRNTSFVFIQSYGLFWYQRTKAFIEAAINLSVSLILLIVFKLGINGVLIGTTISSFGFVLWYEAYVIYKHALKRPMREFVWLQLRSMLEVAVLGVIVYLLSNWLMSFIGLSGLIGLVLRAAIAGIMALALYVALYWRREDAQYLGRIIKRILRMG